LTTKPRKTIRRRTTRRTKPPAAAAPAPHPAGLPPGPRCFAPLLCIVGETGPALWGRSTEERLVLQFAREGVSGRIALADASRHNGPVVLVRADAVLDQPLIAILLKRLNLLLIGDAFDGKSAIAAHVHGAQAAAVAPVLLARSKPAGELKLVERSPAELDANFWKALRKRETPYAMVVSADNRSAAEWRMFMGTYKGATDFVTKHLWPVPAFHATRFLAPRGISPNMVTATGALLMVVAFWLFLEGHFIAGLLAAWAMTFLDTVDGKLARTTLTSSKWGDIADHGIDLLHPPFWYAAWAMGLAAADIVWPSSLFWLVIAAILGGYLLQRIIEGVAIKWLGLEIHIWRPIDTLFRQVTARRNPNLLLLTLFALAGRPDLGLVAVALWTVICLLLHGFQLVQALGARRQGPLTSWMTAR
jgi:phosphatidylglycerophosphate synthase